MGFFNIFKKKRQITKSSNEPSISIKIEFDDESTLDDLNTVDSDNDLPWGWVTKNREFTDKINKEYSYFLNIWIESRNKSPRELYSALKSFVQYLEDTQKLCKSKGKYFELWFNEYLTGRDYLTTRQKELSELSGKWIELQKEYELRQKVLPTLHDQMWTLLMTNQSMLQTDLYKHFDDCVKSDIQSILYTWDKSGKIIRTKNGRTYLIKPIL